MNNIKQYLAALIIGKNVISSIQNTIESVKPYCSQIVFVDTGSDDGTPEFVSKMGAEIFFFKWIDDFSEARNFGLKFIRTDWILSIDSDEQLIGDNINNYFDLLQNDSIGGLTVNINNLINPSDTSNYTIHKYTRIFRKHFNIRFKGKIHEQIRDSIENTGFEIIDTDISINHLGYLNNNPQKQIRNLELLNNELRDNDNDVYLKYHLASTEFSMGDLKSARTHFQDILDSSFLSLTQNEMVRIRLAQIALNDNRFEDVFDLLSSPFDDKENEGLRLFVLAAAYMSSNNFKMAKELYENPILQNASSVDKSIVNQALAIINTLQI
jgi:glycosyltransferase involved in cell wall biosynthesis